MALLLYIYYKELGHTHQDDDAALSCDKDGLCDISQLIPLNVTLPFLCTPKPEVLCLPRKNQIGSCDIKAGQKRKSIRKPCSSG